MLVKIQPSLPRKMFFVYVIQNLFNLKIYVGKTNDYVKRFSDHKRVAKQGFSKNRKTFNLIHKSIKKYGVDNFSYQIIDEFENEKECLEAEKFWIEFFRSDVNRFGNECGYNLTAGGDGLSGRKHSPEEKLKVSQSLKGRKLTQDHKNKISSSLIGKKLFNKNTKIIWPPDLELLQMVNNTSYMATAKTLGVSNVAIRERLKRRNLK